MITNTLIATFALLPAAELTDVEVAVEPSGNAWYLGDPLYLSVTLTNRGETPVAGPNLLPELGTFRLEFFDETERIVRRLPTSSRSAVAGLGRLELPPGGSSTTYLALAAPYLDQLDDPFWVRCRDRQRLLMCGVWILQRGKGAEVRSPWRRLELKRRNERSLNTLRELSAKPRSGSRPFISPLKLGGIIRFGSYCPTKEEYRRLRSELDAGSQLVDLIAIAELLDRIHVHDEPVGGANHRQLLDLVSKQPQIERQSLKRMIRGACAVFDSEMLRTARAIDTVGD